MGSLKELFSENKNLRNIVIIGTTICILLIIANIAIKLSLDRDTNDTAWDYADTVNQSENNIEKLTGTAENNKAQTELTEKEIREKELEIERNKPKFNMEIQTGLDPNAEDYATAKKMPLEKFPENFEPKDKIYKKTLEITPDDIKRLQEYYINPRAVKK